MTTGLTRPTRLTRLDNSMDSCSNKVSHVPLVARGLMNPAQGLSGRGTGCNSSVERHAAKAQLQRRGRPAMRGCVCVYFSFGLLVSLVCLVASTVHSLARCPANQPLPTSWFMGCPVTEIQQPEECHIYPCGWYSAQSLKHLSWCVWDVFWLAQESAVAYH